MPPKIECERVHPMLLVKDIHTAVDYYCNKLGFTHGFTMGEPPEIAGVNLGDVSVHLYFGEPNYNSVYFVVSNADELYEYHRSNNVDVFIEPEDRVYAMRDYSVRDPWGNQLSFGHYLPAFGDPVKIERVEVPLRLEKRLVALLHDLAAHKNMTIDSLMEETLLHTFEVVGNNEAVASPHTKQQHTYIQELKKKHGIDYDTHASYRFVEG